MRRFLIRMAVIAGIAAAFICLWMQYRSEHRERRRLEANQHSLLTDIQFYRMRDSLSAAGVERLTLSNREFREYAGGLEKTVNTLQLKVRRLQSASRTGRQNALSDDRPLAPILLFCVIPLQWRIRFGACITKIRG